MNNTDFETSKLQAVEKLTVRYDKYIAKLKKMLSKARKLKVEVEQHAGYNEALAWVYAEGAYEIMGDAGNAQSTSVRATVAQKNVKTAQDVLERLRGEWEELENGE